MNSEVSKQFLGALTRNLLQLASGWLVAHGWLTTDQVGGFDLAQISIGIAGFIITMGWSWYQKLRTRIETKVALAMPSTTTEAKLKCEAAEVPVASAFAPIGK